MPDTRPTDEPLPPRLLQDTAALFGLLSATVRLHILWLLADGDLDVGTLAEKTGQSVATWVITSPSSSWLDWFARTARVNVRSTSQLIHRY